MNGVTVIVALAAGAPTTPLDIELIWRTQVLRLRAGGAGLAEISLKSSRPPTPWCSEAGDVHIAAAAVDAREGLVGVRRDVGAAVTCGHGGDEREDDDEAHGSPTWRCWHRLPSYEPGRRMVRSRRPNRLISTSEIG